jgi:hypothetical protein
MTYNEKVIYIAKLCNIFAAAIFDSHSCAAKDSIIVVVVVPMADGEKVISSSLWHPSRV